MSALDRKLVRELRRLAPQALAIALVMACGFATIVLALGAYRSLEETRRVFYDHYRFADLFARVTRAPLSLGNRILAIDGVASLDMRVTEPAILDLFPMPEPATGLAVSLPDFGAAETNRLYLRQGRLPETGRAGEVAVLESFAAAHRLSPGDRFPATIHGHRLELTVTGIVLSPEYIYALGPGDMVPDSRRFGVLFMPRSALEGLTDREDAFNDLALRLLPGARPAEVTAALDALLKPFGGTGAHGRTEQMSHAFLDNELMQLKAMASVIPPIFLFVSAFLVNMILSRLMALEREQIGLLKALGFGTATIAGHYLKLTLVIALMGVTIGALAGNWLGQGLTALYARFFSFPFLIFRQSADLYLIATAVTALSAVFGAARAVSTIAGLAPAVAMKPPAPVRYRQILRLPAWLEGRLFSELTVMALRHLVRWPVRSLLTTVGASLSVGLLVTALFSTDSIDFMIDTVFFRAERQDATLFFASDRPRQALADVRALPGVMAAEPMRAETVVLRRGSLSKRLSLQSLQSGADLSRVLDTEQQPVTPLGDGLLLTERVARLLQANVGDAVEVTLVSRGGRTRTVTVAGIVDSYVGLGAYLDAAAFGRMTGAPEQISAAHVMLDEAELPRFYDRVKATPAIASVALQGVSQKRFRETIEQNISIMTTVYVVLAVIITFGVIYNSARIQLSERARELASLRVLGFTRGEVSRVLMVELALIVLVAQPLGWASGTLFSAIVTRGFESDLFRVPFVITIRTYAVASLVVLAAAALSALVVRRRIDRLDLVEVLKTRE